MFFRTLSRNVAIFKRTVRYLYCKSTKNDQGSTGVLCDIDGVLLRGRQLIPGAKEAIQILYKENIPVVFLTNQGLQLEEEKAESLSKIFQIRVKPEQVVLSHSPMRLYKSLHEKFVLVLGQQNIHATAYSLGFKNICALDDIRSAYPLLDMIDKQRRYEHLHNSSHIANIEGIVLLGEPVRWESAFQLCIDLLVSNGKPSKRLDHIPKEHIPIVACNTDLLWMAEAPLPRFGHGAFLLCLESLYKKITGYPLKYSTITGKPFLITYQYAEQIIQKYLQSKQPSHCLKRIYVIGDNPDTDVYGGNMYKEHIKHSRKSSPESENHHSTAEDIMSILVATGVHSKENLKTLAETPDHVHKDIKFDPHLRTPDYSVENIVEAVELIMQNESNYLHY